MLKLIYKIKGTTTKQGGAVGRQGANTESFILNAGAWDNPQYRLATRLKDLRAALLPTGSSIYGSTFVQLDALMQAPEIPSYTNDVIHPGAANLLIDQLDAAIKVTMHSKDRKHQKELKLGFIPDARVLTGEYHDADGYNAKLEAFLNELDANWCFRSLDQDADVVKVQLVGGTGLVTISGAKPGTFVNDAKVRFLGARSAAGRSITGTYTMRLTDDNVIRLVGWDSSPFGGASVELVSGELMLNKYIAAPYSWNGLANEVPMACRKKVGRPSDLFVGRRATKR